MTTIARTRTLLDRVTGCVWAATCAPSDFRARYWPERLDPWEPKPGVSAAVYLERVFDEVRGGYPKGRSAFDGRIFA